MFHIKKIRDLDIDAKPNVIKSVFDKGNKLCLYFKEDTFLGKVDDIVDMSSGIMKFIPKESSNSCLKFKSTYKEVDGGVYVKSGNSIIVDGFLYHDEDCARCIVYPYTEDCSSYLLPFPLYGYEGTCKIADNVEEVSAIECQGCLVCVNISEDPRRADCYLKISYYIDLLNNAIKRGDKTVLNKDGIPLSNFFVVDKFFYETYGFGSNLILSEDDVALYANFNKKCTTCCKIDDYESVCKYIFSLVENHGTEKIELE